MWDKYTGPALIAAIGLIGLAGAFHTPWGSLLDKPFVDGKTQSALETAFNNAHVIRTRSIEGLTAMDWLLFGEPMPGAVVGRNGWLFTDEEYRAGVGFDARLQTSLDRIDGAIEQLNDAQIEVEIALIPDKARIMSEHLARPRPPLVEARYQAALDGLADRGLMVQDLRPVLVTAKSEAPVFMMRDTHWTPFGARAVAQAIAPALMHATDIRGRFETRPGRAEPYRGDLMNYLDTGLFAKWLGLNDEYLAVPVTVQVGDSSGGLFGDVTVPTILVGTSFSALQQWNFTGALQEASQTDILNLAEEGRGPFAPMMQFLADLSAGNLTKPDIVVWEIPERYLTASSN